ncbi:hypothetical protein FB475_2013 [Kribbella jejuensis]|uniref:Uncharacterized protein n=1 Tax=Kribbella jejuensis TaxID=236068 RepID=A0A542ERA0_9ACTN|nr:hypothetical protein FB475_2013 [Kribbella jejuensis]
MLQRVCPLRSAVCRRGRYDGPHARRLCRTSRLRRLGPAARPAACGVRRSTRAARSRVWAGVHHRTSGVEVGASPYPSHAGGPSYWGRRVDRRTRVARWGGVPAGGGRSVVRARRGEPRCLGWREGLYPTGAVSRRGGAACVRVAGGVSYVRGAVGRRGWGGGRGVVSGRRGEPAWWGRGSGVVAGRRGGRRRGVVGGLSWTAEHRPAAGLPGGACAVELLPEGQ